MFGIGGGRWPANDTMRSSSTNDRWGDVHQHPNYFARLSIFALAVERRYHGDFNHQVLDVKLVVGERFDESIERFLAVSIRVLFDEVMEHLLHKYSLRIFAGNREFRKIDCVFELNRLAARGHVLCPRIDLFCSVGSSESSDGVVAFERKSQRVDDRVARHAAARLG